MQKILHLIGVQDSVAVLTKIGTFRQIGKGVGGYGRSLAWAVVRP